MEAVITKLIEQMQEQYHKDSILAMQNILKDLLSNDQNLSFATGTEKNSNRLYVRSIRIKYYRILFRFILCPTWRFIWDFPYLDEVVKVCLLFRWLVTVFHNNYINSNPHSIKHWTNWATLLGFSYQSSTLDSTVSNQQKTQLQLSSNTQILLINAVNILN